MRKKAIILGAAGKAFHVFYTCYRSRSEWEVIAFVADPPFPIAAFPAPLAGPHYAQDIPIMATDQLPRLIREAEPHEIIFARTEVSFEYLSQLELTIVLAGDAEFQFAQVSRCMVPTHKPIIAVCGTSRGCGKTQVACYLAQLAKERGLRVAMCQYPTDDLASLLQPVRQDNESPHDYPLFTGTDWHQIAQLAQEAAELLIFDGGNNDIPFLLPTVYITVVDITQPDAVLAYPSYINVELAQIIVLTHTQQATAQQYPAAMARIRRVNPTAEIVEELNKLGTCSALMNLGG